jgi:homoserine kinase
MRPLRRLRPTLAPVPDRVAVSVPGSSANLGPGFDCLGVALPLRLEVEVERRPGPLEVVVSGRGAGSLPLDASNLVVRTLARTWQGGTDGLAVSISNPIPLAAGGGSSSAAIVAGLAAGTALSGQELDRDRLLAEATLVEGHPDNVAAGIHGGFTLALGEPPLARRIPPPPGLAFVLAVPGDVLATHASRGALRPLLPREDAVYSLQRAALLVDVLRSGALELLPRALDDRIHQPDRAPIVPLLAAIAPHVGALGAYGATLSGAGPSVLVWCPHERAERIRAGVAALAPEAEVMALAPEPRGLVVRT